MNNVRATLYESELSNELWEEAAKHMNMLRNLSLMKTLNEMMSYEAYYEKKLNVDHLHSFEIKVFCKDSEQKHKLKTQSWKERLIEYEDIKIIRVYDSVRKKVYRTALFRFESMNYLMIMHLNEDDDAE